MNTDVDLLCEPRPALCCLHAVSSLTSASSPASNAVLHVKPSNCQHLCCLEALGFFLHASTGEYMCCTWQRCTCYIKQHHFSFRASLLWYESDLADVRLSSACDPDVS